MALIYLSYPWSELGGKRPLWLNQIIIGLTQEFKGKYRFYDPLQPFDKQLEELAHELPALANTPEIVAQMLQVPYHMFLNVSDEVKSWGQMDDVRHRVWRDLFFLLRASVVLVDMNVATHGQQSLELVLSRMRGVPVIGVCDLEYMPPHASYCIDYVVASDVQRIARLVFGLVPPRSPQDAQHVAPSPPQTTSTPPASSGV